MNRFLEYGVYLMVFLLPAQTVWILQEATIGPESAVGLWQYGTLRIYGIEFLILALGIVFVLTRCNVRSIPLSGMRKRCAALLQNRPYMDDFEERASARADFSPGSQPVARRNTPNSIFVSILLLFAGLSIFWSADTLVALFAWVRLCEGAFLFYLFRTTQLRWSWLSGAWIAAALVQSALGIWQFAAQEVIASTALGIAAHDPVVTGTSVVEAGDRRWLRAYGGFPHPNIFGAYLAVSLIVCAAALARAKNRVSGSFLFTKRHLRAFFFLITSQIMLIALLLTFSRGAWLALLVTGLLAGALSFPRTLLSFPRTLLSFPRRRESRISPLSVVVLVSIVTIGIFSTFFPEELAGRFGFEQSRLEAQSRSERTSSIERALPLMKERWIAGTGIGNFTNTLFRFEEQRDAAQPWYSYQPIHNVFLMVFAELGIIGILLLALMLYYIFRSLPVTGYPLLITLFALSPFDHFLWTLPFGVLMTGMLMGIFSARGGS